MTDKIKPLHGLLASQHLDVLLPIHQEGFLFARCAEIMLEQ